MEYDCTLLNHHFIETVASIIVMLNHEECVSFSIRTLSYKLIAEHNSVAHFCRMITHFFLAR